MNFDNLTRIELNMEEDGAYEKVRFSDGTVVTAKTSSTRMMNFDEVSPSLREAVIKTLKGKG